MKQPSSLPTCAEPASLRMSRKKSDIQQSTVAPPGTRAMACPSSTVSGSRRPSAGPRPSEAWPRLSIAASDWCARASSSPWRQTTSPDCHGCWLRNDERWRQGKHAYRNEQSNAEGRQSPKGKPSWHADFFSSLLSQKDGANSTARITCPTSSKGLSSATGSSAKAKPPNHTVTNSRA